MLGGEGWLQTKCNQNHRRDRMELPGGMSPSRQSAEDHPVIQAIIRTVKVGLWMTSSCPK